MLAIFLPIEIAASLANQGLTRVQWAHNLLVRAYQGVACKQIFSVNYGVVEYVAWDRHRANAEHLPNPIRYTYLKASCFSVEKELRISLSAIGIGNFALNDGRFLDFPTSLPVQFDLRAAIASGAIQKILLSPDCDATFLHAELDRLGTRLP